MIFVKHEKNVQPADLSAEHDLKGVELRPLITEKDGARHFAMRLFRLEPGGHTPFHVHAWEHEVFVVSGSGKIVLDRREESITEGDAVFVEPNELHQFVNDSKAGMRMICVIPKPKKA